MSMQKLNIKSKNVITGMGILSPFGFGINRFASALKEGRSAIRNIEDTHPEESKVLQPGPAFFGHAVRGQARAVRRL